MFRFACECDCLSRKEYFDAAQMDFIVALTSRAVSVPLFQKLTEFLKFTPRGAF